MQQQKNAVSPRRDQDFSEWYQQVIRVADLAEASDVRGCMVIKPWGYGIWENIQSNLDALFKQTGHRNAYFPLLIPLSYLEREAQHVEGFAKECAVVTHHRLEVDPVSQKLVPTGELSEPLIIRPTSETIIGATYAKWVQSYRDLPILLNQWANVVRWEMRPRLFLRTAEFLWQEGHTAHETREEAVEETLRMLHVYQRFAHEYLALPTIAGEKSENERFPGAVNTYSIEAMVQDRRAIQAGTSHFLGQNFARASGIKYLSRDGILEHAWTTSWGVSTRLIGTMVMAHSDDDGLVLPPRIAPSHVVIIPVVPSEATRSKVSTACHALADRISQRSFFNEPIRVEVDERDTRSKNWDWIKKGIPVRIEVGPRDIDSGTAVLRRRDASPETKENINLEELVDRLPDVLADIQKVIYDRAVTFRDNHTESINSKEEFYAYFSADTSNPQDSGGFALAHWCGSAYVEEKIKDDLKVTIRCIPQADAPEAGTCIFTGKPSAQRVLFSRSY